MNRRLRLTLSFFSVLMLGAIGACFIQPGQAHAAVASQFKAGDIINDGIFFNGSSMTPEQIQAFLNAKVPVCDTNGSQIYSGSTTRAQYGTSRGYPPPYTCLKDYVVATPNRSSEAGLCGAYTGGTKSSAQIIYDVAQACGVNPQTLLVLLQKEESLVTDTWPWAGQYQIATGFGCPDTAACDSTYYGFFNQVYNAARIYRKYARDASQFNYIAGRNNNIRYNPQVSCGSSPVFVSNQATAGLYNYTPYQPNAAALNNLYGTGDSCSAYGNRNFWRMFYDWFGSTSGGVSLMKAASSPTVYVLYGGQKQGIPSGDVLNAWGLQSLPVTVMDDASASVIPTRAVLTRLARNPNNPSLYLVADSGGTYDSLSNMATNWGYNPDAASPIGGELVDFTRRLGGLSAFMTAPNAGAIYMMDGGSKRAFATGEIFQSWAKDAMVNSVSNEFLNTLPVGGGIFSNQAQNSSTPYLASSGRLLSLDGIVPLYPRTNVMNVSNALTDVLPSTSATRFVKGSGGTIYLMDDGKRHGLSSLGLLNSYAPDANIRVTTLADYELNQIAVGAPITTRYVYDSSDPNKQFYVNNSTYPLSAAFAAQNYGFAMSPAGIFQLGPRNVPISCTQGLVQAAGSAGISILDNGVRRGIASPDMLSMINNGSGNVCVLNPEDVNIIPAGQPISPYVSSGGLNYITEQNKRYNVPASVSSSIGATSFTPVSNSYLTNFTDAGAMTTTFRSNGRYVFANAGRYFSTPNNQIAGLWGVNESSPVHAPTILKFIRNGGDLIPFAKPTDKSVGAIYVVDAGKFLPISNLDHLFNAGFDMSEIPEIDLSYINAHLGPVWQGYLAKDATSDTTYLLEGGRKRIIPTSLLSTWTGTNPAATPTTLSSQFLSLLRTDGQATKAVETNSPGIYAIVNGKKSGIPNIKTFNNSYAPAIRVTDQLIRSLPDGPAVASD